MAVLNKDIILLAADVAPEDDTTTGVGGAVENAASWAGGRPPNRSRSCRKMLLTP
jgi:hypothetical protein